MDKFPESKMAHQYLDGLKGIEIGASWWNGFGLDTINVDKNTEAHHKQFHNQTVPVDIVADGDRIPVEDKSFDFVISSHVLEHFYDPIGALLEWNRIARKYVFIIVPHVDRTFDKGRDVTTIAELIDRHNNPDKPTDDRHWSVWNTEAFIELIDYMGFTIIESRGVDDKVGNGIAVIAEVFK